MAFEPIIDIEQPKFSLVSQYTVTRYGKYPVVRVGYIECVHLLGPDVPIVAASANEEGEYTTITVDGYTDDPSVVGRTLAWPDSTVIGTVTDTTTTPEGTVLTLSVPLPVSPVGQSVALVEMMPVGTLAYRPSRNGKQWELAVDGSDPLAMQRMGQMLGTVYVKAGMLLLQQLGVTTVTVAQVQAAVQALAATGTNIDGLLAQEGEKLEQDRRQGLVPFIKPSRLLPSAQ